MSSSNTPHPDFGSYEISLSLSHKIQYSEFQFTYVILMKDLKTKGIKIRVPFISNPNANYTDVINLLQIALPCG